MADVRVVIQAGLFSPPLSGKALLPIAGEPAIVLAAKRAANRGHSVLVSTSGDPQDDELASVATRHGFPVRREKEPDLLRRLVCACEDMAADGVVVRLTVDDVFSDGELIDELVREMGKRSLTRLCCRYPWNGLPYGVGPEAFTVAALRKGAVAAEFRPAWLVGDFSHLRSALEALDDYTRLDRLFSSVRDPVRAPIRQLCEALATLDGEPTFHVPFRRHGAGFLSEMTLGTAQLGMAYGAANATGMPSYEAAREILETAIAHGVTALDTASGYGESEQRIGKFLGGGLASRVNVITKLDPLGRLDASASSLEVRSAVEESVFRSCRNLGLSQLPTLLLHRWDHRTAWREQVWSTLLALRERGVIGKLGASVYLPHEAIEALGDPDVSHLQLPFNLLDWRWRQSGFPGAVHARPDVTIHARSALLQGTLAASAGTWPKIPGVDAAGTLATLEALSRKLNRKSRADLCLAYVRSQPWIASIVVGVETLAQLETNLELFREPPLSREGAAEVEARLGMISEDLLIPSRWPRTA